MKFIDKEYCLRVKGPFACFTRPELKVERVSYDVITPSAARAIFQAIFWKPAIRWQITKIEVLSPIKHFTIKRNEVAKTMSPKSDGVIIEDERAQKFSYILRDVDYRIYARMIYIPVDKRSEECRKKYEEEYTETEKKAENPGKYQGIFERRAGAGQCFTMPYLGAREFTCNFELVTDPEHAEPRPISESRDFGIMLYDLDFDNKRSDQKGHKDIPAMFYLANMENGVILVPDLIDDSNKILR